MKRILISIFLLFSIVFTASAGEQLVEFSEDSLPVLNEELRKLEDGLLWKKDGSETELKDAEPLDMQDKGFTNTGEAKELIIENRTADPTSPSTGQIWYRSDL